MLQITEPNKKNDHVVGIDLGTTHSLIAYAQNGDVTIFTDEEGNNILPSVVLYDHNQPPLVGKKALRENRKEEEITEKRQHSARDRNTVSSIKRLMGRGVDDVATYARQELYRLMNSKDIVLRIGGRELTPVEISADILKSLKSRAEKELNTSIENAVITVPAYFNDSQRTATKVAARIAGLNVLRLLSEPTAAALAYGLDRKKEGTYLVYDMGGGTFDISLLKLHNGIFQVIATGGDTWLGGDDIDKLIAENIEEYGGLWPARLQAARKIKEQLSDKNSGRVAVDNIVYTMNRETMNSIVSPLIEKTIIAVKDVLTEAKTENIDGIIMVGGSTRMPLIRKEVAKHFNAPVITDLNPDEIVVHGAALQAASLMGDGDSLLLDVTPLSLGIETAGGLVEKIIHRNTAIPIAQAQEFTTFKDGQTAMDIHILQGERETVDTCRSLAKFRLTDIPPMPAGAAKITVTYILDADGMLTVAAKEETTGHTQQIEVNPTYGLEEDKILDMIKSSFENATADINSRSVKELQTELDHLINACEKALKNDGGLLSSEESSSLYTVLEQAKKELNNNSVEELQNITASLDESFSSFAEKRMNNTLKESIVGLPVSKFE